MGTRWVMYDVTVKREAVEKVVRSSAGNLARAKTLSAKPKRQYRKTTDYRSELESLYQLADQGMLEESYGPFDVWGSKTRFKEKISILLSDSVGRTTLQNCMVELLDVDAAARSRQIDQQLTNN